jgi:hypothetical protein
MNRFTRPIWRLPPFKYARPQRLFLVPPLFIITLAIFYTGPELFLLGLRRHWPFLDLSEFAPLVHFPQLGAVYALAVVYGLGRLSGYHPSRRSAYVRWLEQTPWTPRQPLPLGPVHFGWRDLLLFGILLAGALHAGIHPASPLIVLGATYLIMTASVIAGSGAPAEATVLAFALPALTFLAGRPWVALLVTAALYAVGYAGLRRSLAAFPWRDPEEEKVHPSLRPPRSLPWPMNAVGPVPPKEPMSWAKGLIIPLLVGWCIYSALGHEATAAWFDEKLGRLSPLLLAVFIGVAVALFRWVAYAAGHCAPISLWGRLRYGPLLVPRFDQIYVAPICTAVIACVAPGALHALGLGVIAAFAASIALVLAAAINFPPTRYQWKLTGAYRVMHLEDRRPGPR